MTEQDARRRLGVAIRADRLRLHGTVENARVANGVKVSRGTWDKAERGEKITEWKLADIERALGWDAGKSREYLHLGAEQFPAEYADQVRASDLSDSTKEYLLKLLADERPPTPPSDSRGEDASA